MAKTKRTDALKFRDAWDRSLTPLYKCIWEYFIAECDHAGILKLDYDLMSFQIGAPVTIDDVKSEIFGDRIIFISKDEIFIPKTILFQQGIKSLDELNPKNNCHLSIIKILEKRNLYTQKNEGLPSPTSAPSEGLGRGYSNCNCNSSSNNSTLKEEGVLGGEEKEISLEEETLRTLNPDIFCVDNSAYFKAYTALCTDLLPITFERRNKEFLAQLLRFRQEIDDDVGKFKELCKKANSLKTIANNKLDFKMILNNYVGILNGKYENNAPLREEMNPDNFFKGVAINDQG